MTLANIGGPTGNQWADLVIATAAVLTALGWLWKKVAGPAVSRVWRFGKSLARGVDIMEQIIPVIPTLVTIGREFQENGGSTLKDTVQRTAASLERVDNRLATGRAQIVELVAEVAAQGQQLNVLEGYAHDNNHQIKGALGTLAESYAAIAPKVDELAEEQARVARELAQRHAHEGSVSDELAEHREVMERDK